MLLPVQMLWIGPRLSNLERLSIASFLAHGHEVRLYTYGEVDGVPAGAVVRDAREILPESAIFTYAAGFGRGSPAAFANHFRYKLLLEQGGIWCDCDVVCLKPFEFAAQADYAIATERLSPKEATAAKATKLNACFMKAPAGSALLRESLAVCEEANPAALRWGDTGPSLMTRKFAQHHIEDRALLPDAICPWDWWEARRLIAAPLPRLRTSHAIHLWNEVWRYHALDKDGAYPAGCAYETLKRRYAIR